MTKKQGAGTSAEHYVQDAAEIYLAALLQQEAENQEVALKHTSKELLKECSVYYRDRNVEKKFLSSKYRRNIDVTYKQIIQDIIKKYFDRKFHFKYVDVENRNLGKKGDIVIVFDDSEEISVSVKN